MAYAPRRNKNLSLNDGATDGKYIKPRPNTQVGDLRGDALTRTDRAALNVFNGFGSQQVVKQPVVPGKN